MHACTARASSEGLTGSLLLQYGHKAHFEKALAAEAAGHGHGHEHGHGSGEKQGILPGVLQPAAH